MVDSKLLPNAKELRALRIFISTDETRLNICTLWRYAEEGGTTYVATDGHTMAVRRSGKHRDRPLYEIAKLHPWSVDDNGEVTDAPAGSPPGWDQVLRAGATDTPPAKLYGMNPAYFARVGDVERAVGQRSADDYVPPPGMSKKDAARKKVGLKGSALATWIIPSAPLDAWYWRLDSSVALYEGVVMPRRV